jgi:hypothetical protein
MGWCRGSLARISDERLDLIRAERVASHFEQGYASLPVTFRAA